MVYTENKQRNLNEQTLIKALEDYQIEHKMLQSQETIDDLMRKHRELNLPLRIIINRNIEWIQQTRVQ